MSESLELETKSKNPHSPKITKENIITWLGDKRGQGYRDWLNTKQPPLRRLEKISESLKKMIELEFELKEHYLNIIPFLVQALNLTAQTLTESAAMANSLQVYTYTNYILQATEALLKNNPQKIPVAFQRKALLSELLANLNRCLPEKFAQKNAPDPIKTPVFFSLISQLHKYKLLAPEDLPKLMFEASKLLQTVKCSALKVNRYIEILLKDADLDSPQASEWWKSLANLATSHLLQLPLKQDWVTQLMSKLLTPGRRNVDIAGLRAVRQLEKMSAFNLKEWDFKPVNDFLTPLPTKPLQAYTRTLMAVMDLAAHLCRRMNEKNIGDFNKISRVAIESAVENFLENSDCEPRQAAQFCIAIGQVVQCDQPAGSGVLLQEKISQLLIQLNTLEKAKNLSLAQLANVLYGALLLDVLNKDITCHLYKEFQQKLKVEVRKKNVKMDKIHIYVSQVAEYADHSGQIYSKEMEDSVKKRAPVIKPKSFQHQLICRVQSADWFKKSQEASEEKLKFKRYSLDCYVKLKNKNLAYNVEIDSVDIHGKRKVQDRRRDKFLLAQRPEENEPELIGIIRIPVYPNTSLRLAAADWQKKYEKLIKSWELTSRASAQTDEMSEGQDKPLSPKEDKLSARTEAFYSRQESFLTATEAPEAKLTSKPAHSEKSTQKPGSDPRLSLVSITKNQEKKHLVEGREENDENQNPNISDEKGPKGSDLNYALSVLNSEQTGDVVEQKKAFTILSTTLPRSPLMLNTLGQCYEYGIGVAENSKQAFHYYQLAMENGFIDGQFNLGRCYEEGIGVKADAHMAMRLYGLAAEKSPGAQNRMGELYLQGALITKDLEMAYELFQEAASVGYPPALHNLAKLYLHGAKPHVQKNIDEAVAILQDIAAVFPPACVELGRCFEQGWGLEKNLYTAFRYYQEAAKWDIPVAQYELGRCFLLGIGHKPNRKSGLENLDKAAKNGCQEARVYLEKELRPAVHPDSPIFTKSTAPKTIQKMEPELEQERKLNKFQTIP